MVLFEAEFVCDEEIPLSDVLGSRGTYVVFPLAGRDQRIYIGQGRLTNRVLAHAESMGEAVRHIAVIEGPDAEKHSQILETTLLAVAEELGIRVRNRVQLGNTGRLAELLCEKGPGVTSIRIRGEHPLRVGSRLKRAATVSWRTKKVRGQDALDLTLEHPWRRSSRD